MAKALARLPDFKSLSEATRNFVGDNSLSWTEPYVARGKTGGAYWKYVARTITIAVGIATVTGVLVSESLRQKLVEGAASAVAPESVLAVASVLFASFLYALALRNASATPRVPKGLSLKIDNSGND